MNASYKPIACSLYDVFEVAALKGRILKLSIDGAEIELKVRDVYAKGKEEYLEGNRLDTGHQMIIRLDRIQSVFDPTDNTTYVPDGC
ncbi:MAG TPA: Rho-binding antiterminator [Bacteroidota bacterium]|nr:Rho-binding antiterminator [Bacteroidota bacterium]